MTNESTWRFYDGVPLSDYWGTTQLYLATPTGSWEDARNNAFGMDGKLVQIDNATENTLLDTKFPISWIGYSRPSYGANFQWLDGGTSSYTNWASGQPNNSFNSTASATTIFSNDFSSNNNGTSRGRGDTVMTYQGGFGMGRATRHPRRSNQVRSQQGYPDLI